MKRFIVLLATTMMIFGCASYRGEPGPKLYDNATISIISNNILLPQIVDKDFTQIVITRLDEFTKSEIQGQGNLELTPECGQRTLKIIQDITSIVIGSVTEVRTGFLPFQIFRGSATATKGEDIAISTIISVYDCESGKRLGTYNYTSNSQNPIDSLKYLAAWNVSFAYRYQYGPRF